MVRCTRLSSVPNMRAVHIHLVSTFFPVVPPACRLICIYTHLPNIPNCLPATLFVILPATLFVTLFVTMSATLPASLPGTPTGRVGVCCCIRCVGCCKGSAGGPARGPPAAPGAAGHAAAGGGAAGWTACNSQQGKPSQWTGVRELDDTRGAAWCSREPC